MLKIKQYSSLYKAVFTRNKVRKIIGPGNLGYILKKIVDDKADDVESIVIGDVECNAFQKDDTIICCSCKMMWDVDEFTNNDCYCKAEPLPNNLLKQAGFKL